MRNALYYDEVYSGRYHVDEDRVRYVGSLCSGPVLDIGCGDGRLAQYAETYLGLDFSQVAVELACHRNPGKRFRVLDFLKEPLPQGPWQTVVMGELLEHLDDEAEALLLSKVQAVLAPGGHVVGTVPKGESIPDESHVRVFEDGRLRDSLAILGSTVEHRYSDKYLVVSAHRKRPKLSVVLIVKNEEELLGQCLDSLSVIWDELVIVDTGSQDSTVDIAKSYGARMGFYQWHNDFAAARNYAESLCFGEYVYWQDADEVLLEGHETIRRIVEEGRLDGVAPRLIHVRDAEGRPAADFVRQEMLHKNNGKWAWVGAAHNWLQGSGRIERPDIVVEHLSRPSGDRPNHDDIYDALRSNFKDGLPERQLFYLAREHFYHKHWHECIGLINLMMQVQPRWPIQRSRACLMAGDCWRMLGENEAAHQSYLKALAEHAGWAEPYFSLGRLAHARQHYDQAIAWFLASTSFEPGTYFVDRTIYDWQRWDCLALACYKAGRYEEAVQYGERALAVKPTDTRLQENLRYYRSRLNGATT